MKDQHSPRKGAFSLADKIERRSQQCEFRATDDEGVIEGYVCTWGAVDSYGSAFQRGAFAKTLQERGGKVRVLWNHEESPIGVPLEMREDDRGLFVRLQLVMSVRRARETFDLIRAGAIDSFSFGFRAIKDAWVDGVRQIKEVALFEISPVIFPANESALITGVRNMQTEVRAEDFASSYASVEMPRRHQILMDALDYTLMDVFWGESAFTPGIRPKMEAALTGFVSAYLQYVDEYIAQWAESEQRSAPSSSELARVMRETINTRSDNSPEALAADTSLTVCEVRTLLRGGVGVAPAKLAELPEEVRKAYAKARSAALEHACAELRNGISPAERDRINGLINPREESAVDVGAALARLDEFRKSLTA